MKNISVYSHPSNGLSRASYILPLTRLFLLDQIVLGIPLKNTVNSDNNPSLPQNKPPTFRYLAPSDYKSPFGELCRDSMLRLRLVMSVSYPV